MGLPDEAIAERLGRLRQVDLVAVNRLDDAAVSHTLDGICRCDSRQGRAVSATHAQAVADDLRRHEGPGAVVDGDQVGRSGPECAQAVEHRLPSLRPARDDEHLADLTTELCGRGDVVGGNDEGDVIHLGVIRIGLERPQQQRAPSQGHEHLRNRSAEPLAGAGRHDQRRHPLAHLRPAFGGVSSVARSLKIILPALVCSALVTTAGTVCPTNLAACSTTTMVPSSR